MSLELVEGFPVLLVNYGSGTTRLNNSVVHVADGKPHLIEIVLMRSSIEMFVDRCKLSTCMSLAAPTGPREILNGELSCFFLFVWLSIARFLNSDFRP